MTIFKRIMLLCIVGTSLMTPQHTSCEPNKAVAIAIACGLPIFVLSGINDISHCANERHRINEHKVAVQCYHGIIKHHNDQIWQHRKQIIGNIFSFICKCSLSAVIAYYLITSAFEN